jgi:hypothetical protein
MMGEFGPTLIKGIKALDCRTFRKSKSTVRAALCAESADLCDFSASSLKTVPSIARTVVHKLPTPRH